MLAYSQTVSGAGSCCGVAPLVLSRRSFRNNPRYAHLLRRGVLFSVLVCLSALGFDLFSGSGCPRGCRSSARSSYFLAVFLPLSVCPRSLSSGFSAVSSGVGGFSRFRRSADRLRLSDIALCALGRSVLPLAGVCSFLPCLRCCRGLGLLVGRCPSFGRGLLGSLIPFTFLSAF